MQIPYGEKKIFPKPFFSILGYTPTILPGIPIIITSREFPPFNPQYLPVLVITTALTY